MDTMFLSSSYQYFFALSAAFWPKINKQFGVYFHRNVRLRHIVHIMDPKSFLSVLDN